jgi:hypothetical protein
MLGGIVMTGDLDDEKRTLNNPEPEINRGVELLLRNRRKRPEPPKTFQVKFGKMVTLLPQRDLFYT